MLEKLTNIAEEAGKLILEVYYQKDFDIKLKEDNSPLTEADKKSHQYIIKELKNNFPGIPILSEEGELPTYDTRQNWDEFFLVDPLDGTKEFIKRNDEFTVNIALIKNKKPALGVINVPVLGDTYFGSIEEGSYKKKNGESYQIKVSNLADNDELTVVQSRSHSGEEEKEFYSNFNIKSKTSKGSSLKICLVAEGLAELYFRSGPTWEWDTGAGHAILLGAGGYFINKDKSTLYYNKELPKHFGFIASAFRL